jgi:hypothetical protein
MSHRPLWVGTVASFALCAAAQAATSLTLDPAGGSLSGLPGASVGWGFQLFNDENFLVVTSAEFSAPATIGSFTDYIAAANFFAVGPGPSSSIVWAQKFDPAQSTGIGGFLIDAGVPLGTVASGHVVLTYDLYARNPMDAAFDPDTDTLSNGNVLKQPATITVGSVPVIPEPGTWALMLAGAAMIGLRARRRRPGGA